MESTKVQSELRDLEIDNVYIYVADAVRWDYLSEDISELGTSLKTVSASTTSAPSFSSLITGLYPSTHGVYTFKNQLAEDTFRMLDVEGYETEFLNSIFEFAERDHEGSDPIYPVLGISDPSDIQSLTEIESPFLYMERGPGGHLPYGDFRSTSDYFDRNLTPQILREDYERSIRLDESLFFKRLHSLEERGLLDDTLVIYTSDHGELLGENGLVGHNSPMCPELVHVPTVFIHEDISNDVLESPLFEHISLLPTILSIIDHEKDSPTFDGTSLLDEYSGTPCCSIYYKEFLSDIILLNRDIKGSLKYEGVWDSDGGYVFAKENIFNRLFVLGGQAFMSPKRSYLRTHLSPAIRAYMRGDRKYGDPQYTKSQARTVLEGIKNKTNRRNHRELTEQDKQHLEDLGYL